MRLRDGMWHGPWGSHPVEWWGMEEKAKMQEILWGKDQSHPQIVLKIFFKLRESMLPINSGLYLLTVIILTYLHVCTIYFSWGKVKMKELKKIFISQKRNLFFIYFSTSLTKSSCPIWKLRNQDSHLQNLREAEASDQGHGAAAWDEIKILPLNDLSSFPFSIL